MTKKKPQMRKNEEQLLAAIENFLNSQSESCPYCMAVDYPVCGDRRGYDEVTADEAEEWNIDHEPDCVITLLDSVMRRLESENGK